MALDLSREAKRSAARRAYQAAWYAANLDRERAKRRAYREAHRAEAAAYFRSYRAAHPERVRAFRSNQPDAGRAASLRRVYGITPVEYEQMLTHQLWRCWICLLPFTKTPHVDHVETSAGPRVRGLLCHRCNTAIGALRDDPEIMARAATYVARGVAA